MLFHHSNLYVAQAPSHAMDLFIYLFIYLFCGTGA
jgi:hypothetical protein